jgi:AcrR family transcriptional regulator
VRHDRDDVVAAALGLLDQVGLPDLTMRRLAAALGVQPSALYRHFASKQALLAALADRITAEDGAAAASAAPAAAAARLRTELLAHRDGAEVVASTFALGLGDGTALDRLTTAFRGAGLPQDQAAGAAATLLHFVLGSVQLEQQRRQAAELGISVAPEPPGGFGLGVDLIVRGARTPAPSQ